MRAKRDYRVYLEDIVSAIGLIGRYTANGREDFLANTMVQDAVMRQLSIIGEAAGKLPASLKQKHAGIPWKKIIGMRNVLIHDYGETDIATVWATVTGDLPELRGAVEGMILEGEPRSGHRRKAA